MSSESNVLRQVWVAVAATTILFRVNTGKAWLGAGPPKRLVDGSVVIPGARPVALGYSRPDGTPVAGTADLMGWTSMRVTPSMVGCRVAVVTAIETKRTTGGRTSDDQRKFLELVQRAGGIAGVANSADAARAIVAAYVPQPFDDLLTRGDGM